VSAVTEEPPVAIWEERPRRRWRRRLLALVVILAAGAVTLAITHPFRRHPAADAGNPDTAAGASLATVSRRTLTAQTQLDGKLGYADTYTVAGQLRGTVTALPAVGQVIKQGQVLYRVDGQPVVLLNGSTPAYRALAEGAEAADVTGRDVQQLNAALVALGYASADDLDPTSDEFGWATKAAVKQLQAALGVDETGRLALGDVVFEPTALRVTELSASLGTQAGGPVLKATSMKRHVSIKLDADLQSTIKVGDTVTITLPDGRTTPGRVSSVGSVATSPPQGSSDSSPTIDVDVTLTEPKATGTLDQAPVQVAVTTDRVKNALVVPVTALVALAGGGYALEVVGGDGVHHLVAVTLGVFDDSHGLVQVTGSGLAVGQHVVVPSS
jgi:peptidoglycan hydrolase-like protein with peptidoglycan-binding domain